MYNLDNIMGNSIGSMRTYSPNDPEIIELEKEFSQRTKSSLVNLDIDDWDQEWDNMLYLIMSIVRWKIRMPIIDRNQFIAFLAQKEIITFKKNKHCIGQDSISIAKRLWYFINKYYHLKEYYHIILENYIDFNRNLPEDIRKGLRPFEKISLLGTYKGGLLHSERIRKDFEVYIGNLQKRKMPTLRYIKKYPPFDIMDQIASVNDKKINTYFKKEVTKELFYYKYLDRLNIQSTKQERLLGYCFLFSRLCLSKEEFMVKKSKEDKYYSLVDIDEEFEDYLRNEGHNVLLSLSKSNR